jgi:hypothetical protein
MSSRKEAIGCGSFFKCHPYDYTNDKFNLLQGHEDCIRMVNLLPANRKRPEENDNDPILPTDWLECTGEIHPSLDLTYCPGTWKHLCMGDLMTQYGSFYTNADRQFGNWHAETTFPHDAETKKQVKAVQMINAKCNLPPNTGVEQLKKERA